MGCQQAKVLEKAGPNSPLSPRTPLNGHARGGAGNSKSPMEKALNEEKNEAYRERMCFLGKVPLFQRLPRDQHPLLASACEPVQFAAGSTIITCGDAGSEFFVIRSGEAQVIGPSGAEVARLQAGDYFGEMALLRNEPRSATVIAASTMSTLKITREKFQALRLNEQLKFGNRKAVGGGGGGRAVGAKPPSRKTSQERAAIVQALRQNTNLGIITSLNEETTQRFADVAWEEPVARGKKLITQGDLLADYFYIVKSGRFDISIADQSADKLKSLMDATKSAGSLEASQVVGSVGRGGSFGELALLYAAPRAATVSATEDSVVWVIDRGHFKDILMRVSDEKVSEYVVYLESVDILKSLTDVERRAVAEALMEVRFVMGEVVLRQGEPGSTFYILCEGEVSVVKDGVEQTKLRASTAARKAQYFGERALLNREPRAATIVVTSPTAKVMALDQESFNLLLGPLEDIFKRRARMPQQCVHCWSFVSTALPWCSRPRRRRRQLSAQEQMATMAAQMDGNGAGCNRDSITSSADSGPRSARPRIRKRDLRRIGLLGCGAFGTVELYEHIETQDTFALKALSKGYIVKTGMEESVMNERFILMMTNSKFIIALYETFNGSQTLYFLLEPALGGELHATYMKRSWYGSTPHARYYIAGVVFAFEHLHERRIIYRDLKPENLLLDEFGHLKVADMGLSKFVIGKTYTTCGTPDYFAPELITSSGHTIAVDWWMLGILLFELMTGKPPFEADSHMQTYTKVLKGIGSVSVPPVVTGALLALIKAMLQKEPSERLPMRPGGVSNLKGHKWFSDFRWDDLATLTLAPPYKPEVKSKIDISNFFVRPDELPEHIPYEDDGSGWDKEFATA